MRVWPAALLLLLATGCGFLRPTKSEIFTVEVMGPVMPPAPSAGVPIGIDTVELPPGFDRKEIVILKQDGALDVRGREQWVAPLEQVVLHTIAHDLARRLPEGMVVLPGQAQPAAMRSIDLVFEQLTAGPENTVVADVRWTVRQGGAASRTRHERVTTAVPSLSSANVARGMSETLAQLADRIVSGLQ